MLQVHPTSADYGDAWISPLNGFLQHAINIWVGDGERSLILEPEGRVWVR